ncbi:MAG: DUF99 family protein [Rivularia sp. (in: cyanobacteria)]
MNLESLLKLNRTIRVIGFDDAPFIRGSGEKVNLAGIICAATRFEGMVWGELQQDGFDSTETICNLLLNSKFLPQLHIVLLDGIGFGGFNLVDLPTLAEKLQLPCVAVMRRQPDLDAVIDAMSRLPDLEKRKELLKRAGKIHEYSPFVFQVCGEEPEIIAKVLEKLTDCGKVPEALRLAHLISAAVIKGESGSSA